MIKQSVSRTAAGEVIGQKPSQLLYITVRNKILADLTKAGLKPGERYFTEGELVVRHNASRNTIRRAMADLEEQGYIKRQRGQGSFVCEFPASAEASPDLSRGVSLSPAVSPPLGKSVKIKRLVVILASWDDTADGFYSSRVLQEITSLGKELDLAIEVRHPTDEIQIEPDGQTAVLAMDPRETSLILNLNKLASQGVRIILTGPKFIVPLAMNLCDALRQTACEAVKQFIRMGHRHVGIIYHSMDHRDFSQSLMGFIDAHSELNHPIHPQGIVCYTNKIEKPSLDPTQITAWICTFNAAVNLLATRCQLHDLSIPEDVSLVCFDSPNERVVAALGKQISVMRPDARLIAKNVFFAITHREDGLRGEVLELPMQKVQGQTIAPPQTRND